MTTFVPDYRFEPYTIPGAAHGGALRTVDLLVLSPLTYYRRVLEQSYDWPHTLDMSLDVAPVTARVVNISWASCLEQERRYLVAIWNPRI